MSEQSDFDAQSLDFLSNTKKPNLPPSDKMVKFGLEMLSHSSIGIGLLDYIRENNVKISVTTGPKERAFSPDGKNVVIVLRAVNPANPSRFVLLLVGGIRELMQENSDDLATPPPSKDGQTVLEQMRIKDADRLTYMCGFAYEINQILTFSNYHIIEELKDMGHEKAWTIFENGLYQYGIEEKK